ncbi:MAG: PhoH family protein [Candidatus Omnitrophica bacterium]|nr:PhoH family protein [Candidatus Omnitrophota bacterium]
MEEIIELGTDDDLRLLVGPYDENIRLIQRELSVDIVARGRMLKIKADSELQLKKAKNFIVELIEIGRRGLPLHRQDIEYAIKTMEHIAHTTLHEIYSDTIEVWSKKRYVAPRTEGQKRYVDLMRQYDIVFAIGPAGTGKTYLAMAMAVCHLKRGQVSRIILTRPAVEAGESLGFLPGDMHDKVTPYLRPLYDALYDMMEINKIQQCLERGIIEVAPLAYMRGRTLNDSFIILDEAQNSTPEQMKMFLTRLGFDSKAVITGDITQSDLPVGKESGLIQVQRILKTIDGIAFSYFSGEDVVRHELVQRIIRAYAELDQDKNDKK